MCERDERITDSVLSLLNGENITVEPDIAADTIAVYLSVSEGLEKDSENV